MSETMISNEINEEVGLDTTNIQEMEAAIHDEIGIETPVEPSFEVADNSIITDEYFNKVCADMENMNFIEITKIQKELKNEKEQLISAKDTVENIISMKDSLNKVDEDDTDNDLTSAIDEANAEFETGISDMKKFIDNFDETMDKMDKLIARAEEISHKFDDVKKTTSFLNDAMIQIVEKNLARMENNPKVTKNIRIFTNELKNIFTNRTSVDFILSKIPDKKSYVRRLKNEMNKETGNQYVKSVQKNVTAAFCSVFSVKQMQSFEDYLKALFNIDGDTETVFYFQYVLYLIYNAEKTTGKYGKHKWIEMLIMNVLDIVDGNYDLEGGEEFYKSQLLKLREAVIEIM